MSTHVIHSGGEPTCLAATWLTRSLVALDVTYLPHMKPISPTNPSDIVGTAGDSRRSW